MFRVPYDLHMHSCLSPCGDMDMTPGNIVGMAMIKELDVIALTDHNTVKNCPSFLNIAKQYGIIAIPGMELTTMEEVHVVCLFEDLKKAMAFNEEVYGKLQKVANCPEIFGQQVIMNDEDEPVGIEENLLINATDIGFDDVWELVNRYDGVMIPAHIDKKSNSLLANLGFIPEDSKFTCVEVKNMDNWHRLKREHPYLEKCNVITSSDAHYLENINEPINYLTVREKSVRGVLDAIREVIS